MVDTSVAPLRRHRYQRFAARDRKSSERLGINRMDDLKLIALDPEDLRVLSCHLQDAVIRVGDMAYLRQDMRFAAIANRFDWERAASDEAGAYQRRRSGLRFERVKSARVQGFDLQQKDAVLVLLAVTFESAEEPSGAVTLHFAGGGAVRLEVECIEAELRDLGAVWGARSKPVHASDD
jgi:hypothetical protein